MTKNLDNNQIIKICKVLYQATRPIKILSHIEWKSEVREKFLQCKGQELPQVEYPPFDSTEIVGTINQIRNSLNVKTPSSLIEEWLVRQCAQIEKSALMLESCATPQFHLYSGELYGTPLGELRDENHTALGLANKFDQLIQTYKNFDFGTPAPACHLASFVADEIRTAVTDLFKEEAPEVLIVDELSANALAGANRIRIKRDACFTDKDVLQLIQHEAYIHVATALNGQAQSKLQFLSAAHPGTTKTQEGLAVFSEFISGTMDIDRMKRLADRVLAIQMAIEGADFLEVYRYFLDRTGSEVQAYENSRRVFRGGVLTGKYPFTKDIVYLDGFLRVQNFLRTVVDAGRADCLNLLFVGKIDIEDIPVMYEFYKRGLISLPKYIPPWAKDLRYLLCFLTYSTFVNDVELTEVKHHYQNLISTIPKEE